MPASGYGDIATGSADRSYKGASRGDIATGFADHSYKDAWPRRRSLATLPGKAGQCDGGVDLGRGDLQVDVIAIHRDKTAGAPLA